MPWIEIIEFLGGATAISLTIAFLGKKAIEAYLAGRVEAYKNNLERIANEHSIRFQRLHAERAEVIKDFYGKLSLLDDTLYSTLRPFQEIGEPELKEKVQRLSEQFNDLRNYFLPKRIFFEEKLCDLIDRILEAAKVVFYDITTLPVDTKDIGYKHDRELLNGSRTTQYRSRFPESHRVQRHRSLLDRLLNRRGAGNDYRHCIGLGQLEHGCACSRAGICFWLSVNDAALVACGYSTAHCSRARLRLRHGIYHNHGDR